MRALLPAAILVLGLAGSAYAQRSPDAAEDPQALAPALPDKAPGAFKPDADTSEGTQPDVWIFSGTLQDSHESFSGTLVAGKGEVQFEMKLGGGTTCDGKDLSGEVGLVRLKEITCSDDRVMKALFVPQGGQELKVFGHVGDERFMTSAHLLGSEPVPEKKQTAEPTAPAMQGKPDGAPAPAPAEK